MSGTVRPLDDGFSTTINFTSAGTTFKILTIQPPGLDNGEPIETHSMHSTKYRTKAPRSLISLTDGDLSVSYDPTAYDTFMASIMLNQLLVVTFPDLGTLTFWGYAKSFIPDALEEGKRPTAKVGLVATCQNDSGAEVAPIVAAGAGTGG